MSDRSSKDSSQFPLPHEVFLVQATISNRIRPHLNFPNFAMKDLSRLELVGNARPLDCVPIALRRRNERKNLSKRREEERQWLTEQQKALSNDMARFLVVCLSAMAGGQFSFHLYVWMSRQALLAADQTRKKKGAEQRLTAVLTNCSHATTTRECVRRVTAERRGEEKRRLMKLKGTAQEENVRRIRLNEGRTKTSKRNRSGPAFLFSSHHSALCLHFALLSLRLKIRRMK